MIFFFTYLNFQNDLYLRYWYDNFPCCKKLALVCPGKVETIEITYLLFNYFIYSLHCKCGHDLSRVRTHRALIAYVAYITTIPVPGQRNTTNADDSIRFICIENSIGSVFVEKCVVHQRVSMYKIGALNHHEIGICIMQCYALVKMVSRMKPLHYYYMNCHFSCYEYLLLFMVLNKVLWVVGLPLGLFIAMRSDREFR